MSQIKVNGNKHYSQDMFSEARIALMQEVKQHPRLLDILSQVDVDWYTSQLPEIATYVYVAVDGSFMPNELDELYKICWQKLRDLRRAVIMPPPGSPIIH